MNSSTVARSSVPFFILWNFVAKMVRQRHLVWNFARRDLQLRYIGSFMGFFWSVIHPLVLLVSYTFVFSVVFKIRPRLEGVDNFALFLFCGILPWLYFQDTLLRSCNSVVENANLIKRTLFPAEILPVALLVSNLVTHLVGFALLLVVLAWAGTLTWTALAIPLYLFLLMVLALGLSWLAAALQVFLRDTVQVVTVLMILWFWFTPIFYELDQVPEWLRFWVRLNPMSHVVLAYRRLLLEGRLPDPHALLWLALSALAAFLVGGIVFRTSKREFVDVL